MLQLSMDDDADAGAAISHALQVWRRASKRRAPRSLLIERFMSNPRLADCRCPGRRLGREKWTKVFAPTRSHLRLFFESSPFHAPIGLCSGCE
jgi:hypothetical protein